MIAPPASSFRTIVVSAESGSNTAEKYIIATTNSRNAKLQTQFNEFYASNKATIPFNVRIDFWEDIRSCLSDDKYEDVLIRYYSDFMIDTYHKGFAVGKEVIFIYGVEDNYNSKRDLLFLRIPRVKTSSEEAKESGIGYHSGVMIVDLDSMRVSEVRDRFYESDLEILFPNNIFERVLFGKRLNEMDLLNDVIYSRRDFFKISFSKDEYREYINRCEEERG